MALKTRTQERFTIFISVINILIFLFLFLVINKAALALVKMSAFELLYSEVV